MSNLFTILTSAILVLALARADKEISMSLDDLVDIFEPLSGDCDPKPDKEHIIELIQMKADVQMTTKCLRRCLLEKFEVMSAGENQVNVDKAVDMMVMMYSDKEDEIREMTDKCNKANTGKDDKCEVAHDIIMCIYDDMKTRGYKMPEIK